MLLTWQLKIATSDHQSVIAAKAAIQLYQGSIWIALKLHYVPGSPLRCGRNDKINCQVNTTAALIN